MRDESKKMVEDTSKRLVNAIGGLQDLIVMPPFYPPPEITLITSLLSQAGAEKELGAEDGELVKAKVVLQEIDI